MQTASTNICERMGRSQELSEFQPGTVQSLNFLATKYYIVNCQWYYNKVEATGNHKNL